MPFDGSANNQLVQDLIAARNLIADPENWCQQALQKDVAGVRQFCARGAVYAALGYYNEYTMRHFSLNLGDARRFMRADHVLTKVARQRGWRSIVQLNNTTDHKTVLAAFDAAIAKASMELATVE